jgi:hypothetical protein
MARETIVQLVDDLDGSPAESTVRFGLDGIAYEIDLSEKNENELRTKLGPFLEAATRVRAEVRRGRGKGPTTDKERNTAIRAWALSEGVELAQRGRIANVVQEAYEANDGDMLREALGLELVEEKPTRGRRRVSNPEFSGG